MGDMKTVNGMDVYVLFQEGPFEVRIKSITAVKEPHAFASPVVPAIGDDGDRIRGLLERTIYKGSSLYNKGYIELCAALYWSSVNTIVSSLSKSSAALKHVGCAGLGEAMRMDVDKNEIAWIMRYTIDAMLADLANDPQRPNAGELAWLPTQDESLEAVLVLSEDT